MQIQVKEFEITNVSSAVFEKFVQSFLEMHVTLVV